MPSNVDKHTVEGERPVRLCNYVDVYRNDQIRDDMDFMLATATDAQIERFTLREQDVLATKDSEEPGDIGVPAYVAHDMPGVVCGYHLAVFRPSRQRLYGGFLAWALRSRQVQAYYETAATGISRYALSVNDLGMTPIPLPDYSEQERIANFLNEQTARIDALIAEKEHLLQRLTEHLDSQTSFLLSGGNVLGDRRQTGWRFLPEVPAKWSLAHLRWIAKRVDVGIAEAATHAYAETGVPILRSTNIRPNSVEGTLLFVEPWFAERNASKTLLTNDLVTVRTGYPGVTAVVPPTLNGCQCFTMLITTLSDGYLPEYYARYLNSAPARGYFEVESWGSAQKNISVPILKDVYVPRLPLAEQEEIVRECRRFEDCVRSLSNHVSAHIQRLREYRSSLISAAVSGQIDIDSRPEG
jgi:type I restriction enzyme, S subunit